MNSLLLCLFQFIGLLHSGTQFAQLLATAANLILLLLYLCASAVGQSRLQRLLVTLDGGHQRCRVRRWPFKQLGWQAGA
jgi:hypothetical protein